MYIVHTFMFKLRCFEFIENVNHQFLVNMCETQKISYKKDDLV